MGNDFAALWLTIVFARPCDNIFFITAVDSLLCTEAKAQMAGRPLDLGGVCPLNIDTLAARGSAI